MAQYIDKDALVAEIEKIYKFHEKRGNEHDSSICDVLYGLSHRIDALEVEEVREPTDAFIKTVCEWIENNSKIISRSYKLWK